MARTFVSASSQRLSVASAPATAIPLTMACWWRPVSASVVSVLFCLGDGGTNDFSIRQDSSGHIQATTIAGGTTTQAVSSTSTTAATWAHACAVYTSATARAAFLNGAGKGTDATSKTPSGIANTLIGCHEAIGNFANGDIAECAMWNIALADTEVALLAAGVSPYLIHPEALKFYAPLLHGYSPEIDLIASRNLTLTNAPAITAHPPIRYRGLR